MRVTVLVAMAAALTSAASAEIVTSGETGFSLSHQAVSPLSKDALFKRMMTPADWWSPEHTYSGDAANLSMKGKAGAFWREDWGAGSVIHGQVLLVKEGEQLVLSAPFGPLQATGATCIWTLRLEAVDEGTRIISTHTVAGAPGTGLEALAGPIDFVMGEGVRRLAARP